MNFNSKHEITDITIIIVVLITSIIIGIVGLFAYYRSYEAFIAFICVLFLTYSTISLIYTFLNKSVYDVYEYNINLGLDTVAVFIALALSIYFGIKSFYVTPSHPVILDIKREY